MVKQESTRWKRVVISLFILFHLYVMAVWGLPGSTFRYWLAKPITDYVLYSGLWHSWDMFSPDPLSVNFTLDAEVLYQNGATKIWTFPRIEKLGYFQRFQKERYRKWRERVRMDVFSMLWDDTARYIARINDTPANHPVRVTLIRHWQPIPPPVTAPRSSHPQDYQPMIGEPPFLFNYHFKTYNVQPGDL